MSRYYSGRRRYYQPPRWEHWSAKAQWATGRPAPHKCDCGHEDVSGYRQRKAGGTYRVLCDPCGRQVLRGIAAEDSVSKYGNDLAGEYS